MIRLPGRAAVPSLQPLTLFVIAALVLGLGGCTTVAPPEAPKPPIPDWESSTLIETMKQRSDKFRTLRALVQVDYAGPEGNHGFQEAVIVQRPDRLRLETLTLLGAILIFTANDKEMIGYHPREGVFVRAQPTRDNLRRYTQIPLELQEVTMLLMGLPPVDLSASLEQQGNTLIFSSKGRKRDVLVFQSHQPVPTKWERFNDDGNIEFSAEFSDYVASASGLFPCAIVAQAHGQKKSVSIRYKEPDFNATIPPEQFTQQVPPHAKEVPIEAIGS